MITISHTLLGYMGENECLWGSVYPSGVFWREQTRPRLPFQHWAHIGCEGFTELFFSNIMKYGKNYIE